MRRVKTFLGVVLLATALALSMPGVEVVSACDAEAQSCEGAKRPPAAAAPSAPGCPAGGDEASVAAHEAALARVQRAIAAQAPAGTAPSPVIPLNGRGYNYASPPDDGGSSVLRFEAPAAQPAR
jgi:hypothetical protein